MTPRPGLILRAIALAILTPIIEGAGYVPYSLGPVTRMLSMS